MPRPQPWLFGPCASSRLLASCAAGALAFGIRPNVDSPPALQHPLPHSGRPPRLREGAMAAAIRCRLGDGEPQFVAISAETSEPRLRAPEEGLRPSFAARAAPTARVKRPSPLPSARARPARVRVPNPPTHPCCGGGPSRGRGQWGAAKGPLQSGASAGLTISHGDTAKISSRRLGNARPRSGPTTGPAAPASPPRGACEAWPAALLGPVVAREPLLATPCACPVRQGCCKSAAVLLDSPSAPPPRSGRSL